MPLHLVNYHYQSRYGLVSAAKISRDVSLGCTCSTTPRAFQGTCPDFVVTGPLRGFLFRQLQQGMIVLKILLKTHIRGEKVSN